MSHLLFQHEQEREKMTKRNDKLDEEVKKMRELLKQAEAEISRQDEVLRVQL